MLAPLSGNVLILTGLICWCRGRDGDRIAGISSTDVNVVVVVNVSKFLIIFNTCNESLGRVTLTLLFRHMCKMIWGLAIQTIFSPGGALCRSVIRSWLTMRMAATTTAGASGLWFWQVWFFFLLII